MPIRRILVPTDFSAPSKQAIAYAFELAQTLGATLVLLHVIEELPLYIGFLPPEEMTKDLEDLAGRARLDLAQIAPQAQDGKIAVTCQAVVGAPAPKIIEVAQEMKTARLPQPTSWPSSRLSTTTSATRAPMARCPWGKTRTPSPARRSAPLHDGRLLCALVCLPCIAVD
jgi:hypothetical protein